MTEVDWWACADPTGMVEFVRPRASRRRWLLLCCARLRRPRVYHFHPQLEALDAEEVDLLERLADGVAGDGDLEAMIERRCAALDIIIERQDFEEAAHNRDQLEFLKWCWRLPPAGPGPHAGGQDLPLIRELFGNPFRPATLDRAWLTADVVTLAQAAYAERALPAGTLDPTRMAVLADALEDAGCDHADMLAHLRGEGPHVRGCWAVDLVLGRS